MMNWLERQALILPVFGAVPQQCSSLLLIAAQAAVARHSFHPEAQPELKLTID
jgi:hypothetical protein